MMVEQKYQDFFKETNSINPLQDIHQEKQEISRSPDLDF